MKTTILSLCFAGLAAAQCGTLVWNPATRHLDCIGTGGGGGGNSLTAASVGNSGGIPYFTAASRAMASTATWTANALMKGGGAGVSPVVTGISVDSSNNISGANSISTGSIAGTCNGTGGCVERGQGTAPSGLGTNSIQSIAPTSVTSYRHVWPGAAATGFRLWTNAANVVTETIVGSSGSGSVCLTTSCAMTTPDLGTPSAINLTNGTALPNSALTNAARDAVIGVIFDGGGSALAAGTTVARYVTIPWACTIVGYNIALDTGTATFKTWRKASGTAIPTNSDSISTSGVAISSGTALQSSTVTDWTDTTLDANDIIGLNLSAVASATQATFEIICRK